MKNLSSISSLPHFIFCFILSLFLLLFSLFPSLPPFSHTGETRNGIPRPELGEVVDVVGRATHIYRISNVDVASRSFTLNVMGFDHLSGSTINVVSTQLGGISSMQTQVSLSTMLQSPQSTLQVFDQTSIRVTVDGMEAYIIRLASGDRCMRVNSFTYSNSMITAGGISTNNIAELVRVNMNTGVVRFNGMAPNGGSLSGPGLLCVSTSSNSAFFTTLSDLEMDINNRIMAINVRAPVIDSASGNTVITENGGMAIIGRTVTATAGLDIILTCSLSDEGVPIPASITWQRGTMTLTTGGRFSVEPNRLVIRRVEPGDSGMYSCVASNDANLSSRSTSSVTIMELTQPTTPAPTTPPPVNDDPVYKPLQWSGVSECVCVCVCVCVRVCVRVCVCVCVCVCVFLHPFVDIK